MLFQIKFVLTQLFIKKKMNLIVFLILTVKIINCSTNFPHIIWTFWDKQQTMTTLGKVCLSKMINLHQNTDWKVNFITYSTLKDWLSAEQIEQLDYYKKHGKFKIEIQQFSDLLRFTLLQKYGGVWIDLTTILIQNLNWLDKLSQNKDVFKIGQSPEVFTFIYTQLSKLPIQQQNNSIIHPVSIIQTFFIAAKPSSHYIKDTLQQFKRLILGGQQYFDKTRSELLDFQQYRNTKCFKTFNSYFGLYDASQFTLYKKYRSIKKGLSSDLRIFRQKQDYYHHWTIQKAKGPYLHELIQKSKNIACLNVVKPLFQDMNQIQYYPKYMIKLTHDCSQKYVANYLKNDISAIQQSNQLLFNQFYSFGQFFIPQKFDCLYKLKMHQNSVLNKYLLKQNEQKFKNIKIYSQDQFPPICNKVDILDLTQYLFIILASLLFIIFIQIFLQFYYKVRRTSITKPLQQTRKKCNHILLLILAFISQMTILVIQFLFKYFEYYQSLNNRIAMTFAAALVILGFFIKSSFLKNSNINVYQFKSEIIILVFMTVQYQLIKKYIANRLKENYLSEPMYYLDSIQRIQLIYISIFQKVLIFLFSLLILKRVWSHLLRKYLPKRYYSTFYYEQSKRTIQPIESQEITDSVQSEPSLQIDSNQNQQRQIVGNNLFQN